MSEVSNQHSVWDTEELFERARLGIPPRDSGRSPTHPDNLAATEAIAALKELEVQYAELRDDRDGKGFLRDAAEAKIRRLEEQLETLHEAATKAWALLPVDYQAHEILRDALLRVSSPATKPYVRPAEDPHTLVAKALAPDPASEPKEA